MGIWEAQEQEHNSKYDIIKEGEKPKQVKSTKGNKIDYADARRFWNQEDPFELIVVKYRQDTCYKVAEEIYTFNVFAEHLKQLKDPFDFNYVNDFHEALKGFPRGKEGQMAAKKYHFSKDKKGRYFSLNPKVDSKDQRRLQFSTTIENLCSIIPYKKYNKFYMGHNISNIRVVSKKRNESI